MDKIREELFKYRKRKKISMDGSVPGISYASYRRSRTPSLGSAHFHHGYHHGSYMRDFPQDYTPNFNAPAVRQSEYCPEDELDFAVPCTHEPKLFRPFPEIIHNHQEAFDYDKVKRANEILNEIMQQVYEEKDALSAPLDTTPTDSSESGATLDSRLDNEKINSFFDITDALGILQNSLPADHPDVVGLRQAFHEMFENLDFFPKPEDFGAEDKPSKLGNGDPYINDDIVGLQADKDTALEQFGAERRAQDGGLEQVVGQEYAAYEQTGHVTDVLADEHSQDNWSEAFETKGMDVFDVNPAENEINQAIDHACQMPQPEPDPWNMQYDPFNQMMQPQYMPDPFGMPGMMGPMP